MITRRELTKSFMATAAALPLPLSALPVSVVAEAAGPAYVLEFGFVLSSLHQDFSGLPTFPKPEQTCTVRLMVHPDNTWTVHAGNYVQELGWEHVPTIALDGAPDASAIALLRWLAETALYPQRFDTSGLVPAAAV
ncbi:MAG: hypothetical protein KC442_12350 [Thermomicrobiales bacterium]|nr:hypothetical protein [Thermomicrobiales bacterium]